MLLPERENEWEYDVPERVTRAVDALKPRDGLAILLHLRWQVDALMREVKIVDLTVPELVSIVAVLAPATGRPVINEWDYDVRDRVTDAIDSIETRGGHLATPTHLRTQIRELMQTVKITDLSAPELVALLAVLAPANGRRLIADTFKEALRPILRLVDNTANLGDAALEFCEQITDLPDELAGTHL